MRTQNIFWLLLFLMFTWISCEKLDTSLPDTHGAKESVESNAACYTVEDVIDGEIADYFKENSEETLSGVWIQGYIVGYASASTVASATFSAGDKATNILLADNPFETDYNRCVPVQLSTSTKANKDVRNALNLSSHADVLGKKVQIYGNLAKYMSAIGLKNTTKYSFLEDDFDYEAYHEEQNQHQDTPTEESQTEDENEEKEDNGNEEGQQDSEEDLNNFDPLEDKVWSVSEIRGIFTDWFIANGAEKVFNCYVKGYIVGYIGKNNLKQTSFSVEAPVETNIVIAETPNETDYNKCIAVQLRTGSSYIGTRQALNLKNHPENLHRCVTVFGSIEKYMGALGVTYTRNYAFSE